MPFDLTMSVEELSTITAARTPEEAYKMFAGACTKLIGQAVADSLAEAVGAVRSSKANTTAIDGWDKNIQGLMMDMHWGTPGYSTPVSELNVFCKPKDTSELRKMGIEFEASVGVRGSF